MGRSPSRHQALTVALLCALFFCSAMALTLLGSGIYRSVNASARHNAQLRTALSYLSNQVRSADAAVQIHLTNFGEGDALRLTETDGEGFQSLTWLYVHEGWLKELYLPADLEPDPLLGTPLLELSGLAIRWEQGLLSFTVTDSSGAEASICAAPRAAREVQP